MAPALAKGFDENCSIRYSLRHHVAPGTRESGVTQLPMSQSGRMSVCVASLFCSILLTAASEAHAARLIASGAEELNGQVYDVDTATGAASNPRPTGVRNFTGIAYVASEGLYGVGLINDNTLYRIDEATGAVAPIGPTGLTILEGDLVYHAATDTLLGINYPGEFYRIDRSTGVATVLGTTPPPPTGERELSGLAFDAAGTLYAIDTGGGGPTGTDRLLALNPNNGQVLSEISITGSGFNLHHGVGMAFDPDTGTLFVAEGGPADDSLPYNLYTLNPTTGALTIVGPLGVQSGFNGLVFVPEPGGVAAFGALAASLLRRHRRTRTYLCLSGLSTPDAQDR